jgi:hypothetical protein
VSTFTPDGSDDYESTGEAARKAVKRAASRRTTTPELLSRLPPSGTWRELYSCTMYDADKGIRTGYCDDDMVAPKYDGLTVRLRRKGWSQAKIARRLGHTQQGGSMALQRIAEGRLGRDPRG